MQKYVAGFLFSVKKDTVALIKKEKPEWQKGKLNAIGGKVEEGESPGDAMHREFKEETGVDIPSWRCFAQLLGPDYIVYFYTAISDFVYQVKTMEQEEIKCYPMEGINLLSPYLENTEGSLKIIPNLTWLIPLAADEENTMTIINSKS